MYNEQQHEENLETPKLFLFPRTYYRPATLLVLAGLGGLIIDRILNSNVAAGAVKSPGLNNEALISYIMLIVGLLVVSLVREKLEDEFMVLLRAKALRSTFVLVGGLAVALLLAELFSGVTITLSIKHLVIAMLLSYLVIFHYLKQQNT